MTFTKDNFNRKKWWDSFLVFLSFLEKRGILIIILMHLVLFSSIFFLIFLYIGFFFDSFFLIEFKTFFYFFNINNNRYIYIDNFLSNLSFYKYNHVWENTFFERTTFLRFPYFDSGSLIFFSNIFPYGFLGYGNLDSYWIVPFFADTFYYNKFHNDFFRIPSELMFPTKDEIFFFKFLHIFHIFHFDYMIDFDLCIKFKYSYYISDLTSFFHEGLFEDISSKFIIKDNDLRNTFFWHSSYFLYTENCLKDCWWYFSYYFFFKFLHFFNFFFIIFEKIILIHFPYVWAEFFFYALSFFF